MGLLNTQVPLTDDEGNYRAHRSNAASRPIHVPNSDVARDLARGRNDIEFFALRWLGIRGNPGQVRWWQACSERADDGWRPRYLTTNVSAGNRAGKTLGMAVVVLHHSFYKLGIKPPKPGDREDALRWSRAPYQWYHLGIQQETAELVHTEIVKVLSGIHPAQDGRGCPLLAQLGPLITWEKKFRGEYLWIVFSPVVGGSEIHFRTTQEKAKALLGKDMNGISFDEAAFELYLTTIYQEVLNLRRLSTGGPLHFIGTPTEGHNEFYDLWEAGNPANPNRDPQVASFKLSTRDNIGYGLTQENFDAILRQQQDYLIPQNIDGDFIEATDAYFNGASVEACFDPEMPEEAAPIRAHRYCQGVDPGIAADATVAIALDYTAKGAIVGVRMRRTAGHQTLPAVVNLVREGHLLYQQDGAQCTTLADATGLGGKMFMQEFAVIRPLRAFDFAGTKAKKLELLADLKAVIDRGHLHLPRKGQWATLRRELLGYKLDDRRIHQDTVMALAIAVRHATRNSADAKPSQPFEYF